jgi:hypothetical protein
MVFESCSWQGVLDTTLCDKVCQWLAAGHWFSPVSSTNKTDRPEQLVVRNDMDVNEHERLSNITLRNKL